MLKQVVLPHFEPMATGLGSGKIPKCLENGPFWNQKWVKNGSKTRFSKSDPGPFGMLKEVFLARFEPVVTEFSPFHHMYAPLCALRPYLRAVWWSHLELGEGCRLEDIYMYIYIYIPKRATTGSKRPKNTCLSIPSGLGTTLEKIIFFALGTLVDPPLAPTVRGLAGPPAAPSDQWYGVLRVSLGNSEAWKP